MSGPTDRWEACMAPNYPTPTLQLETGRGAHVQDAAGRQYVDLVAGVAVNSLGHSHPEVVSAVQRQTERLLHTSNLYANGPAMDLAEALQARTHGHKALLVNSGTEANEAALKLMRRRAHDQGRGDAAVLAFEGSFHGRTLGGLAVTGQEHHKKGFGPLPGQIVHVPFNDPSALEAAFQQYDVAGVFAECIQGEGGVVPMDDATGDALGRLCRRHDALLAVDEVQTGVARTGTFWAHEQWNLQPDVVTTAKGLGGGLPVGACLVAPRHAGHLGPGSHGCTFGGNPVAAAAALAVLTVVDRDRLAERAARLGTALTAALQENGLTARGRGLLWGVPLDGPHAGRIVHAMQDAGFLVGQAGKDVVRLAPPLTIEEDDLMAVVEPLAQLVAQGEEKAAV